MSWIVLEPADPDCPKCHGTGTVYESRDMGHYPGHPEIRMGASSFGNCDCRRFENRQKIQDRCEHECECRKCGKKM